MTAPFVEPRYPPAAPGVFRIPQSRIESILRCGVRDQLQRERQYRRVTVPMAIGTAVAAGAKADNTAKIENGAGCRLPEIVERSVAAYEQEAAENVSETAPAVIGRGKDRTADAARIYGLKISPAIQGVLACEVSIAARVDVDLELVGTIDVATKDGIGDLKTGQPWTQQHADASRQLTAYGLLYHARWLSYPRRVWIDSIGFRERLGCKAARLWSARSGTDYSGYVEIMRRVRDAINAGVPLPAPEGAWWCSKAWCEFWFECPCMHGRR